MKRLIALSFLLLAWNFPALADEERTEPSFDSKPIYDSLGNVGRDFGTDLSTRNWVLVSSAAVNATGISGSTQPLNIEAWRFREIINTSTCAAMTLLAGGHPYSNFISSFGVTLSSDTAGLGAGDSYVIPDQGEYWARWSPASGNGSCAAGAGASTKETYYLESKRR